MVLLLVLLLTMLLTLLTLLGPWRLDRLQGGLLGRNGRQGRSGVLGRLLGGRLGRWLIGLWGASGWALLLRGSCRAMMLG